MNNNFKGIYINGDTYMTKNVPTKIANAFMYIDNELNVCSNELPKILDYITNLQEDLANYVNVVLHNRKVIDNLQQRIDKAVEYIKWNLNKNEELIEYFNYDANFNELLNILKGGE